MNSKLEDFSTNRTSPMKTIQRSDDEALISQGVWAGMKVQKGCNMKFGRKKNPVTEWQAAYFNGGVY